MGVQFDNQNSYRSLNKKPNPPKGMAGLLVKKGIAKNVKQANVFLLIFSAIFCVLALIIAF